MKDIKSIDDVFAMVVEKQSYVESVRPKHVVFDHAKLSEEVGELAETILEIDGYKTNDKLAPELRDNALGEVADIMLMAMVIGYKFGFGRLEIIEELKDKLMKWEDKHIQPLRDKDGNQA